MASMTFDGIQRIGIVDDRTRLIEVHENDANGQPIVRYVRIEDITQEEFNARPACWTIFSTKLT